MTTHLPTCPITGEPMPHPGQTLSQTALLQLRGKTNNIIGLMTTLNQRLAGEGRPEPGVHTPTPPASRPPINLALLDQIGDHQDTLETWAWNIMQFLKPSWRMPSPRTWTVVQAIYQQHLPALIQWQYAATMYDETSDALTQLTRIANPNPRPPTMTEEQRQQALEQLTFRTYEPSRAAELATYITGYKVSREKIYEWARRGRLAKHEHDGHHYKVALRDVIYLATPQHA